MSEQTAAPQRCGARLASAAEISTCNAPIKQSGLCVECGALTEMRVMADEKTEPWHVGCYCETRPCPHLGHEAQPGVVRVDPSKDEQHEAVAG